MFLFDNKKNIHLKFNKITFQSNYITDFFDFFDFRSDAELDVIKLDNEDFAGYISRFITKNIILELSQRNCLMKFNARIPKHWLFAIPIQSNPIFYTNNYYVKDNYIAIASPNVEFSGVQTRFSNRFQLYIKKEYLNEVCQTLHLPEIKQFQKDTHSSISVFRCSPEKQSYIKKFCLQLYQIGFNTKFQNSSQKRILFGLKAIQRQIEENIVQNLLVALAEAKDIKPKKVFYKRISILQQAEEMMNNGLKYDLKISDICQELGVSNRTLEYIFKDFYQISPKAYFKQLRLNALHQSLQQKSNNIVISELAEEFGFFHRGQLAKDYSQIFGELPSKTLQKNQYN